MNYKIESRTWPEILSRAANVLIAILCVVLIPYFLFVGSFWGAPLIGLLVQIFWMSVLPILSMPLSASVARRLREKGRQTAAGVVGFIPLLIFLIVGPLLAYATKSVGMAVMGR